MAVVQAHSTVDLGAIDAVHEAVKPEFSGFSSARSSSSYSDNGADLSIELAEAQAIADEAEAKAAQSRLASLKARGNVRECLPHPVVAISL